MLCHAVPCCTVLCCATVLPQAVSGPVPDIGLLEALIKGGAAYRGHTLGGGSDQQRQRPLDSPHHMHRPSCCRLSAATFTWVNRPSVP
jgi:hypothetical protein